MKYFDTLLLCLIIVLFIIYKASTNSNKIYRFQLYLRTLFYGALINIMNLIVIYLPNSNLGSNNSIQYFLRALIIIMICFVSLCTMKCAETINNTNLLKNKFMKKIIYLPFLMLFIYLIISYFTGFAFYIDYHHNYILGKFYYICLIIINFYWLFTIINSIKRIKDKELLLLERKNKIILVFTSILFISSNITIFNFSTSYFVMGATIGYIYTYLNFLDQLITVDSLTKINNRGQLMNVLGNDIKNYDSSKSLYLLMMDLDYFKSINDKHGHIEGDKALIITANLLKRICNEKNYFLARYGGDEFSIVLKVKEKEEVNDLINNIQMIFDDFNKSSKLPYDILISVGYAKYDRRYKNVSSFIALADENLYSNKKIRKGKMKERN